MGSDGRGRVLFTGYYSPVFPASRARTPTYRYPLYRRPEDLVVDSITGEGLGRRADGELVPYPTREEIETTDLLAGRELVWLRDRFDAYLIHIQGSALLELRDGSTLRVSYAGTNGRDYTSVGRLLVKEGVLSESELGLEAMRAWAEANPEQASRYLRRNERFVFFREDRGADWPVGSLGVKVTAGRTLATDKQLFPPGVVALMVTRISGSDRHGAARTGRFVLDQDAGGAIRSPGRADLYFGIGRDAERRAGRQYAEGALYYLLLKPERVRPWLRALESERFPGTDARSAAAPGCQP